MKSNACADCKYCLPPMSPKPQQEHRCTHRKHTHVHLDVVRGVTKTYSSCENIRRELGNFPCSYYKPTVIAFFRDLF